MRPQTRLRCDASRSMRPHTVAVLILRDARTPIRLCPAVGACALLRMRTGERVVNCGSSLNRSPSFHISPCQTAHLVPAARFLRPGFATLASLTPNRGVGRAPRDVRVLGGTPVGHAITRHARRLARRLASHNAGRSPLGAPPWRFFTRGRASVSGMTRIRAASSSQPGRSAWRATSRASRGERLRAARRRTPRLAPPSGSSLEDAPR